MILLKVALCSLLSFLKSATNEAVAHSKCRAGPSGCGALQSVSLAASRPFGKVETASASGSRVLHWPSPARFVPNNRYPGMEPRHMVTGERVNQTCQAEVVLGARVDDRDRRTNDHREPKGRTGIELQRLQTRANRIMSNPRDREKGELLPRVRFQSRGEPVELYSANFSTEARWERDDKSTHLGTRLGIWTPRFERYLAYFGTSSGYPGMDIV